jgi:hypothetical protein
MYVPANMAFIDCTFETSKEETSPLKAVARANLAGIYAIGTEDMDSENSTKTRIAELLEDSHLLHSFHFGGIKSKVPIKRGGLQEPVCSRI